ncbi:MAG: hypothetical protein CMH27_09490 [Micavibrio sp.]|nr:hypothetical protein [Micavibrio sp.]|tara:strand:- start:123 stop:476 length:354 start_codon:yes stop_codon:yes gene_type:complete
MKKHLLITALCGALSVPAFAGDKDMSCAEIAVEMEELAAIETAAGNAETADAVANAAGSAAIQGAAMSGAGSIPFFGSIANVASAVTSSNARQAREDAEKAEKRMIKLETIADMKGC